MNPPHSVILASLQSRFDEIVSSIYRAGSGVDTWRTPIGMMAEVFQTWVVQFLCVDKRNGVIQWAFEDGSAPAAAGVDFLRHYHRIDPRLPDLVRLPVNGWYSCEEHFDEAAVAADPYYTEYLIPYGGRYAYAGKIFEDDNCVVVIGAITRVGQPPLSAAEKAAFTQLAEHFAKAFDIRNSLAAESGRTTVGADLLAKMRQPMILIDSERRIRYRNHSASALLDRGDLMYALGDTLVCRQSDSDLDLTIALRDLALVAYTMTTPGRAPLERKSLRLVRRDGRQVAATLVALRPESTMGGFGRTPQALFTVFEPGAPIDIDPFVLSTTFDLTPAEARLAAMLVNGRDPEQCAAELDVRISTVRSQLVAIYAKTGAGGQADLVRLVLSATAI